jgi:hypothetical protein
MGPISFPETSVQNYDSTKKKTFSLEFLAIEHGSDKLSRNVGIELAYYYAA